uniref:Uncharacterized protein n=1 Tax=Chenopodium quinoa TaxID=63459 RepID=A0A803LS68_CHEQI
MNGCSSKQGEHKSSSGDIDDLEKTEEGRLIGQKAAKEATKKLGKNIQIDYSSTVSEISNIEQIRSNNLQQIVEMKEKEVALKQQEIEHQIIYADVSKMNPLQRKMHEKNLQAIAKKYGWNVGD